jgi:hypothetical protein
MGLPANKIVQVRSAVGVFITQLCGVNRELEGCAILFIDRGAAQRYFGSACWKVAVLKSSYWRRRLATAGAGRGDPDHISEFHVLARQIPPRGGFAALPVRFADCSRSSTQLAEWVCQWKVGGDACAAPSLWRMVNQSVESKIEEPALREELHVVQCLGFRCAAYRDAQGKWRDVGRGDLLPEPVRIIGLTE